MDFLKSLIYYIVIILIVALVSFVIILHLIPTDVKKEITIRCYLGGEPITKILCTKVDAKNNSYYDYSNNPSTLDIFVYENGKPLTDVYVIVEGCGIKDSKKTNEKGYATFSIRGLYLPSGISRDRLLIRVLSYNFYIDVERAPPSFS